MLWVIMRAQFTFLLIILSSATFGQQLILDSLNWDADEFKFYFVDKRGIEEEVEPLNPNEQRTTKLPFEYQIDSVSSFLISDQQQLQSLRSNWKGYPTDEMLLCWYDYFIYVVQNNKITNELRVNLECGQVVTDFGIFNFEGNPFEQLHTKTPVWVMSSKHEQLEDGRNFINSLNLDIILTQFENWIKYDGYFSVDRDYEGTGSIEDFVQLVRRTYPLEEYYLKLSGVGPGTYTFNIYCDAAFYDLFELDKKGNWHELTPNWITYFSEDTELFNVLLK